MKSVISTRLNMTDEKAWKKVKRSETLTYVCKGLLSFDSASFPTCWQQDQSIETRLHLFGVIPAWTHTINFKQISDQNKTILTQENGGPVSKWEHQIKIEARSDKQCIYSDTIEVEAGILTPFVWLFANLLYRYRQKRWKTI